MKYSRFLLVFVVPIVVISAVLALPRMTKREWLAIVLLPVLAVVWTTPWAMCRWRNTFSSCCNLWRLASRCCSCCAGCGREGPNRDRRE